MCVCVCVCVCVSMSGACVCMYVSEYACVYVRVSSAWLRHIWTSLCKALIKAHNVVRMTSYLSSHYAKQPAIHLFLWGVAWWGERRGRVGRGRGGGRWGSLIRGKGRGWWDGWGTGR